jgi:hypothetical protein
MSNLNSFSDALYSSNAGMPITVNAAGITGNYIGTPFSVGSSPLLLDAPSQLTPLFGPTFKTRPLAGAVFNLRAAGTYFAKAGTDFDIILNFINSANLPLAGPSIENKNTGGGLADISGTWCISCTLAYNATLAAITGVFYGWLIGGASDFVVVPTTGVESQIGGPPLQFAVSAFLKSGNPVGSTCTLSEFSADLI